MWMIQTYFFVSEFFTVITQDLFDDFPGCGVWHCASFLVIELREDVDSDSEFDSEGVDEQMDGCSSVNK